jgi:hypothetical protein
MKTVLFVCYGSGHVRMVVPVAQALQRTGRAQVKVLGLTTAAGVLRQAGLPLLQVKDFTGPQDEAAIAWGRELAAGLEAVVDPDETAAYLGLSYRDLESALGHAEAAQRYAQQGRQAFLPVPTMERILRAVRPDLVVATNSPRGERAAIEAAGHLRIPAVCMVDLFAIDEVRWIGRAGYANKVCVLNESVRDFLVAAGRAPGEVVTTGNPAFDVLADPALAQQGEQLRRAWGWGGRRVVLWPLQDEPATHPFDGRAGDPTLPQRVLDALVTWTQAQPDAVLCVRPRAGQPAPTLPPGPQFVVTGQDWPLPPLLHAVDVVATLTSTVGLEGRMAGARLVQVRGSVFDEAMPLARFGLADAAVDLPGLPAALDELSRAGRHMQGEALAGGAAGRVTATLLEFL